MQRRTHPSLSFPSFVTILRLCPLLPYPRKSPPVVFLLSPSLSSFSSPRHGSNTKIKIMVPATPAGIFLLLRSAFSACAPSARQRQPACKSCATGFLSPFGERQKNGAGRSKARFIVLVHILGPFVKEPVSKYDFFPSPRAECLRMTKPVSPIG